MKSMPTETPPTPATPSESAARKPYAAPRLRHLGSVRELTLGATGSMVDNTGFRRSSGKGGM